MKKAQSRPVTTDDLAELSGMISNNFTKINERFEHIDIRFQGIDKRFKEIDQNFKEVRESLVTVRRGILGLDQRFPTIYAFERLSHRVVALEEKMSPSARRKKLNS